MYFLCIHAALHSRMEALVAALLMGISMNKDHFISTAGSYGNISFPILDSNIYKVRE